MPLRMPGCSLSRCSVDCLGGAGLTPWGCGGSSGVVWCGGVRCGVPLHRWSVQRARLLLAMLQERCAPFSCECRPPSARGVTWSACQGSLSLGPSPQSQHRVVVCLIRRAARRYAPPYGSITCPPYLCRVQPVHLGPLHGPPQSMHGCFIVQLGGVRATPASMCAVRQGNLHTCSPSRNSLRSVQGRGTGAVCRCAAARSACRSTAGI
jgi:hypothetical protein